MVVLILVLAFAVSLAPSLAAYFFLKNRMHEGREDEPAYKEACKGAFKKGALTCLPIFFVSLAFNIIERRIVFLDENEVIRAAFHTFIVLALAEELVKYYMFRRHLKGLDYEYSWLDMISFMTIVGLSFGVVEDVIYAFGTNAGQMIVRGITAGHLGYGFIMGYFTGKWRKTGKKRYMVLGFAIPWLMHGAYDFGLSDEFLALSDSTAILAFSLAVVDFILLITMFVFMSRARKNPTYTDPLPQA